MIRSISVVVPIFNEESILQEKTNILKHRLENTYQAFDIVLSENGSTDRTKVIAHKIAESDKRIQAVIDDGPSDYGLALIKGIQVCRFDQIAILELDYFDLGFLNKSYEMLQDYDLIVGSKTLSKELDERPWKRRFFTRFYNLLLQEFFSLKLTETHGCKTFSRKTLQATIDQCVTRHAVFPSELVIRASRDKRLKVTEIGLTMPIREIRPTRINAWKRLQSTLIDFWILRKALKD